MNFRRPGIAKARWALALVTLVLAIATATSQAQLPAEPSLPASVDVPDAPAVAEVSTSIDVSAPAQEVAVEAQVSAPAAEPVAVAVEAQVSAPAPEPVAVEAQVSRPAAEPVAVVAQVPQVPQVPQLPQVPQPPQAPQPPSPPPVDLPDPPPPPQTPRVPDVPNVPPPPRAPSPPPQVPDPPRNLPDLPDPPRNPPPQRPNVPDVPSPNVPDLPNPDRPRAPSLPDASPRSGPSLPRTPSAPGGGSGARDLPGTAGDALQRIGPAAGGGIATAPGGIGGSGSGASPGAAATAAAAADASRARAASLARRIRPVKSHKPLRGRQLRRLRRYLNEAEAAGCLSVLPPRGRRSLALRAGLNGRAPASRATIGRRLGLSIRQVVRLERSSLRTLGRAIATGECGQTTVVESGGTGVSAATGALGVAPDSSTREGTASSSGSEGSPERRSDSDSGAETGGVKGVSQTSELEPSLNAFDGGAEENPDALLLFLLIAGALAAGTALALRFAPIAVPRPAPAPGPNGDRPLLFVDVDGVLLLKPFSSRPPHGRVHIFDMGVLYVPDRVTELLRTLESRFELVWATGWEDRANYELRSLIGLRQDLPVVTFGRGSRYGSAEWKTKPISRHAGDRPAAWIDDNFGASHEHWARNRKSPTLLVEVDSNSGLSEEHVQRLLDWADEVHPEEATAGARHAG